MHFFYEVLVPANTTEALPYEKNLILTCGVITRMQIMIPPGASGLSHLKLLYHEFQLYPLSRNENYHGDDFPIDFDENQKILVEPYILKAVGWNADETYPHAFLVAITMRTATDQELEKPEESMTALQSIIGETV